jgi:hypothetical protein
MLALFDETHGQNHWSQTGFSSRQMHTNFAGLAKQLAASGFACESHASGLLQAALAQAHLLVIPTPTGTYHARRQCWRANPSTLFTPEEIGHILRFLEHGGRLLAFAYRFGDSFTCSNLGQLFAALGVLLNDDAVVDLQRLRTTHPLKSLFETGRESLVLPWAADTIKRVQWRYLATFSILPCAVVLPLATSPGVTCISFNRTHRRISFQSLPIAVAGLFGQGRFALFGGPHVFETGAFGLLDQADNGRFLANVIGWLRSENPLHAGMLPGIGVTGATGRGVTEQAFNVRLGVGCGLHPMQNLPSGSSRSRIRSTHGLDAVLN